MRHRWLRGRSGSIHCLAHRSTGFCYGIGIHLRRDCLHRLRFWSFGRLRLCNRRDRFCAGLSRRDGTRRGGLHRWCHLGRRRRGCGGRWRSGFLRLGSRFCLSGRWGGGRGGLLRVRALHSFAQGVAGADLLFRVRRSSGAQKQGDGACTGQNREYQGTLVGEPISRAGR
jgi:hypothetical protein